LHQDGAVFDQDFLVGEDFRVARTAFLEQQVLRLEGAAVARPRAAVGGVDLCADEVEITSSPLAGTADQFEVLVSHPDHQAAIGEVFAAGRPGLHRPQ
jgi:hypothetical protein